jgi:hypothetical protein
MKTVLAELHELINELEDQGLTAEASTLQEVFVRVAEADMEEEGDDLANDVKAILESHSAAEVLAEIAKQMGGADSDTETMSFAFGDEPGMSRDDIVRKYSSMYLRSNGTLNPRELAAQASEETGTDVSASEITRGPGYNAQAAMADALGGHVGDLNGRMSPNE